MASWHYHTPDWVQREREWRAYLDAWCQEFLAATQPQFKTEAQRFVVQQRRQPRPKGWRPCPTVSSCR